MPTIVTRRGRSAARIPRQEGLVAGAVEHGARVVGHAPIDRDVGAQLGQVLDRPDRVEGDGSLCCDGPTWLSEHVRVDPRVAARSHHCGPPLGDRWGFLGFHIGDAEPTADRQLREAELTYPWGHDVDRLVEEVGHEHLAADVHVNAYQLHRGRVPRSRHGSREVASGDAEPELGVRLTGSHELVGVGFHTRSGADQHPWYEAVLGVKGHEAIDLVEAVHDDATNARPACGAELVGGLVVPVQHEPVGRHTSGQRNVQLAASGHVDVHALFMGQPSHGNAQERLRGVGHPVTERGDGLATARSQVLFVVDEQRRTEPFRQLQQVTPADADPTVVGHHGTIREKPKRDRPAHAHPKPVLGLKTRLSAQKIARERCGGAATTAITSTPARTHRAGRARSRDRSGPTRRARDAPA